MQRGQNAATDSMKLITPERFTSCNLSISFGEGDGVPKLPDLSNWKVVSLALYCSDEIEVLFRCNFWSPAQERKQYASSL